MTTQQTMESISYKFSIIFSLIVLFQCVYFTSGVLCAEAATIAKPRSSYWSSGGTNLISESVEIPLIERDQLFNLFNKSKEVLFIDTRLPTEFEKSHLPNAINIPFSDIEKNVEILSHYKDAILVPYCNWDFRAYVGALNIKKLGFSNVKMMYPHGLKGWMASGLPLAGKEPDRTDREAQGILYQFVTQYSTQDAPQKSSAETYPENGKAIRLSLKIFPKSIEPQHIEASVGDRVILDIEAVDEDHWFVMPDFHINLEMQKGEKKTVELLMTRKGYFPYGCISCCLRYQCKTRQAILVDTKEDLTKYGE